MLLSLILASVCGLITWASTHTSTAPSMLKAKVFQTNITANPEHVRDAFAQILVGIRQAALKSRDKEEKELLGG